MKVLSARCDGHPRGHPLPPTTFDDSVDSTIQYSVFCCTYIAVYSKSAFLKGSLSLFYKKKKIFFVFRNL